MGGLGIAGGFLILSIVFVVVLCGVLLRACVSSYFSFVKGRKEKGSPLNKKEKIVHFMLRVVFLPVFIFLSLTLYTFYLLEI